MRHESGVDASPANTATCRNALWASKPSPMMSSFTTGSFVWGSAASAVTHGSWFLTIIRVAALTGRHKRRDRSQSFHPVYCGVALQLNEAIRPVAKHFEDESKLLLGREALARRQAAMHARAARLNGPVLGPCLVFALMLAGWLLVGVSGLAPRIPLGFDLVFLLFTVAVTMGLGRAIGAMLTAPDDEEMGAVGMAGCSSCGAFVPFKQGEAVSICTYCRAPALEPTTLAYELLKAGRVGLADGQERSASAQEENWRTARELRLLGIPLGVKGVVALVMLGAVGMTGALLYLLIAHPEGDHASWWMWLVIATAVVAAARHVKGAVKDLMADHQLCERRFNARIVPGDAYGPPGRRS